MGPESMDWTATPSSDKEICTEIPVLSELDNDPNRLSKNNIGSFKLSGFFNS